MPELGVVQNVWAFLLLLCLTSSPHKVCVVEGGVWKNKSQFVCLKGMLFDSFSWTKNHCKNWWQGLFRRERRGSPNCLPDVLVMALLPHGIEIVLLTGLSWIGR